jgi:endo-1,4-beta-mannosidase
MTPFLMGVNYWPRKKAMYWWADFDLGEVREEFAMIRDIGLTHVRLFLLWESFQPAPDRIDAKALGHLRQVCDVAAELGLQLQPTFFTGHMSGPNWAPDWLLASEPRLPMDRPLVTLTRSTGADATLYNVYTEPFVIEAEKRQLTAVCGELRDHPAIWGWSLGNEPDLFCLPPDAAAGRRWVREMTQTIRAVDPHHPVLIGLHTPSFDRDCGLRVDHIAAETDISVMHGYSIYSGLARQPLDPDWLPFTCALTAALAGRPVLYEEMGLCTLWEGGPSGWVKFPGFPEWGRREESRFFATEADGAAWYAATLPRLVRIGALGAFCWCFGDYDRALWDRPPCDHVWQERTFGLYAANGRLKEPGKAVRDFALTRPVVQPAERKVTLPVPPDEYYRAAWMLVPQLYEQFGRM